VLVVSSAEWASDPVVSRLVDECRAPVADRPLVARLLTAVAEVDPARVPPFSALADGEEGLVVLVNGAVQVAIPGGELAVNPTGQRDSAWITQLGDQVAGLSMGSTDAGPPTSTAPWLNLCDGAVPGSGVTLVPVEAAVLPATGVSPATPEHDVMVWGVNCKESHFNDPDARYCRICGVQMVNRRHDLVLGPRPVIGYLVVDDGSTYKLDTDYMIGCQPEAVSGLATRRLVLTDVDGTVSPTHAAVRLNEWEVFVADSGSRFGTHVWMPGASEWTRLEKGQSLKLAPHSHLLLGGRRLVFEAIGGR
jgi:hypothetical protein